MTGLIDIEIEDERWLKSLDDAYAIVNRAIAATLKATDFDVEADLVVLLCDDAEMRSLNREFRKKDQATNVLSFPAPLEFQIKGEMAHLGDIALGFETCLHEAKSQNKPLQNHLSHLCIHGCLHLLGYDHEDEHEAQIMENLERQILAQLGIDDPYKDIV
jgi:probable rRNA maturation factor